MRQTTLLLSIPALLAGGLSPAAGLDGQEPVNVIAETGLDVGPCVGGGALSYPPTPYKGTAYFLRKADATLARRHEALTGQSGGSAAWIRRLDGPSAANRLFTAPNGERAIVFWSCKAHDCGSNSVYGAYGLASTEYRLQVGSLPKAEVLGSNAPVLQAAVACARAWDDSLRHRAAEPSRKSSGS